MKTAAKILVAAGVVLLLAACPNLALKDLINKELGITSIRVGSIADAKSGSYGYTLDGAYMTSTRAKLLNTGNFGPAGTVKRSILITDIRGTVDAKVLETLDVLFIGTIYDGYGYLSSTEIDAIVNWVKSGGTAIVTTDYSDSTAVAAAFGYTGLDYGPAESISDTTAVDTPIFSGPFGDLYSGGTPIYTAGVGTYFADESGLRVFGTDASGPATVSELDYGSGKVIFLATVDFIDDLELSLGPTITPAASNDVFLGNLFAYVKR